MIASSKYTVCVHVCMLKVYLLRMYRIAQNIDRGTFDGYWFVRYLMENIIIYCHCFLPCNYKCCNVLKFDLG